MTVFYICFDFLKIINYDGDRTFRLNYYPFKFKLMINFNFNREKLQKFLF